MKERVRIGVMQCLRYMLKALKSDEGLKPEFVGSKVKVGNVEIPHSTFYRVIEILEEEKIIYEEHKRYFFFWRRRKNKI
ncbi:MAG: hypothetical protein QXZ17_02720 [Nitrososphaerota archaeon]